MEREGGRGGREDGGTLVEDSRQMAIGVAAAALHATAAP